MAYTVVKFVQTPLNNINRLVVVPSSWILLHRANSVVVAYPGEDSEITRSRVARRESCSETWLTYTALIVHETDSMDDAERLFKLRRFSGLKINGNNSQEQANTREEITNTGCRSSPTLAEGDQLHSTLRGESSSSKENDQLNSPVTNRILIAPVLKTNRSSKTNSTPKRKTPTKPKSEPKRKKNDSSKGSKNSTQSLPSEENITPEEPMQVARSRSSNNTEYNKTRSTKQSNNKSKDNLQKNNLSPIQTLSSPPSEIEHLKCGDSYTGIINITKESESGKLNINGGQEISNPDTSGLTTQSQEANKGLSNDDRVNNTNLSSSGRMNDSNGEQLDQTTPKRNDYNNVHRKYYDSDLKVATFSMYISKLDKSVTEEQLKNYFVKHYVDVLDIKLLPTQHEYTNYSSFKVTLNESVRYKVFRTTFWPNGIVYKQYKDNNM